MSELFKNPDFWYTVFIISFIIFAYLVIKVYIKKLKSRYCTNKAPVKINPLNISNCNEAAYPYSAILVIDGMVNSCCANKIENAFNALDGVKAEADVNAKSVALYMHQPLTDKLLLDMVSSIGSYKVMKIIKLQNQAN